MCAVVCKMGSGMKSEHSDYATWDTDREMAPQEGSWRGMAGHPSTAYESRMPLQGKDKEACLLEKIKTTFVHLFSSSLRY